MYVKLLDGVTGTTTAPTAATDGHPIGQAGSGGEGLRYANRAALLIDQAATGALSGQFDLYLYSTLTSHWYNVGTVNRGSAITGTTTSYHAEMVEDLSAFDRVALVCTAESGTGWACTAYLNSTRSDFDVIP